MNGNKRTPKVGDILIAKDVCEMDDGGNALTIGKKYECFKVDTKTISIKDDEGREHRFNIKGYESWDEFFVFEDEELVFPNPHQWALKNGYIKLKPNQSVITWEKGNMVNSYSVFSRDGFWFEIPQHPPKPKKVKVRVYQNIKTQAYSVIDKENENMTIDDILINEFEREV